MASPYVTPAVEPATPEYLVEVAGYGQLTVQGYPDKVEAGLVTLTLPHPTAPGGMHRIAFYGDETLALIDALVQARLDSIHDPDDAT